MEKLKRLNEQFSTLELAVILGVAEATIRRWMKGKNVPHKVFIKKIDKLYKRKVKK